MNSSVTKPARFLYVTCQVGAEIAIKRELAGRWPGFRFAYSRPGFLTFKLPEDHNLADDFDLRSVFARAYGFSLGKATGRDVDHLAKEAWKLFGDGSARHIHVWERDTIGPGDQSFEPLITPTALEAKAALRQHCPLPGSLSDEDVDPNIPAGLGELVLDCVMVEPGEWWVGYHRTFSAASRWPGGMIPLELPAGTVSRAWLKMEEGLEWSKLPIGTGSRCLEIGSAPGGGSQSLLARGALVTGIDPAAMDPVVLGHPNFKHIRRRVHDVSRSEFRKVRWITADMNVAPKFTLDVVEEIVMHPETRVLGVLLTLKLLDWKLASEVPRYIKRVRGWGYNLVRARQLSFNRQEICLYGRKKPHPKKIFRSGGRHFR